MPVLRIGGNPGHIINSACSYHFIYQFPKSDLTFLSRFFILFFKPFFKPFFIPFLKSILPKPQEIFLLLREVQLLFIDRSIIAVILIHKPVIGRRTQLVPGLAANEFPIEMIGIKIEYTIVEDDIDIVRFVEYAYSRMPVSCIQLLSRRTGKKRYAGVLAQCLCLHANSDTQADQ